MSDELLELAAKNDIVNETWRTFRNLLIVELDSVRQNLEVRNVNKAIIQIDYIIDAIKR